jgi:hypothetical protein
MRDDKRFISWTYDPLINRDRAEIILDMLRFVREGLRDQAGPPKPHAGFYILENAVKAALFERLQSPMAKPVPKRALVDAGDTVEMVAQAFDRDRAWVTKTAPTAAFPCGKITDALQQRLDAFWHPEIDEEKTGLEAAVKVAFSNACRAGTRLVLMHVIPTLLELPDTPPAWSEIREELWVRKVGFQRDLLVFSALLGGDALKDAIKHVAPQTCYSAGAGVRYSMIHFLQRDGYSPGRWMSVTEEGLERDIKERYELLTGSKQHD